MSWEVQIMTVLHFRFSCPGLSQPAKVTPLRREGLAGRPADRPTERGLLKKHNFYYPCICNKCSHVLRKINIKHFRSGPTFLSYSAIFYVLPSSYPAKINAM